MRLVFILWGAILLSACSMQGLVEKSVPEDVRENHAAHIDSLLAKDNTRIIKAFNLDMTDEAVQANIKALIEEVPGGKEIRRDYVGMNSSSGIGTSEGKTRDISLVTEVQTEGGFMTVTSDYKLTDEGDCCALTNINVKQYESSPMREGFESVAKVAKLVGLFLLLFLSLGLGLIIFFVMRSKRKRAAENDVI